MTTRWITAKEFARLDFMAVDAMGTRIDSAIRARAIPGGIEVDVTVMAGDDPAPVVGSKDGGVTLEDVTARVKIPGGEIMDLRDEEEE